MNVTLSQILADLTRRLPNGWFGRTALKTGVIFSLLFGFATAFTGIMAINQYVALQVYIQTTSGGFLDLWVYDFLGDNLLRAAGESDASFRGRAQAFLFAPTVTRQAIIDLLTGMGFTSVAVREPFCVQDTAAFNAVSYFNQGARFGSRSMPGQFVVEVAAPNTTATGTISAFNQSFFNTATAFFGSPPSISLSVLDLYAIINLIRAAGIIAWVKTL